MYIVEILNDNEKYEIHTPFLKDKNKKVTKGEISKEINKISSFSFTIYSNNIGFNKLFEYSTRISIYNTKRNRYDFLGRILQITGDMDKDGTISKSIVCEDYFGYLCDSKQHYVESRNWTLIELINHILNEHNSQVEEYKHFFVGKIEIEIENLYLGIQRETTWKTITEKIIEKVGGEIQFREIDGKIYIDFLNSIGETKATTIKLAKNMESISKENDISGFITRLVPLGTKLTVIDEDGKEVSSEERLTIEEVNDGIEYIDDAIAINVYGIIRGYKEWDDVTDASTLLSKAKKFLSENNKINICYNIDAIDLALINMDMDSFDLGNSYPTENNLLNINETLRIIKQKINIIDPNSSNFDLGNVKKTLTDIQIENNKKLDNIDETIKEVANNISNVAVTNVTNSMTSLIQQYAENILSTVAETYLSESELETFKQEVSTKFEQTSDSFQMIFNSLTERIETINGTVSTNYNELIKYIRFVDGTIVLGEVGNEITLQLDNDRLSFYQNGVEVAYINNNILYITDAIFLKSIRIGNFEYTPRSNGSLDFRKVEI